MSTFSFQPHEAPGREGAAPAQPTTGQPSAPAGGEAPPAQGIFGGSGMILIMLLPLAVMLLLTRNQSKRQKQLEANLKVGERVMTQSGLIGRLLEIGERTVKLEIAPGVNVQMLKSTVQGVDPGDKAAADAKAKDATAAKDKPQEKKA